jgi:predicted SnoaL-like aldol condensation-catalyzing enzyme
MAADYTLLQVFETGDVSQLDSIIAPNFINHAGPGDIQGLAAQKAMVQAFHKQVPDVKMEVKRRWADDDYVSDWISYAGAATVIEGIELTRYANGKAVEHWFFPSSRPKKS